jgi:hypothetical protein
MANRKEDWLGTAVGLLVVLPVLASIITGIG